MQSPSEGLSEGGARKKPSRRFLNLILVVSLLATVLSVTRVLAVAPSTSDMRSINLVQSGIATNSSDLSQHAAGVKLTTAAPDDRTLPRGAAEQELLAKCGAVAPPSLSGLSRPPIESVVLMSVRASSVDDAWRSLLQAYVSKPQNTSGPYYTFMRERDVSLWELPRLPHEVFYGERVRDGRLSDAKLVPLQMDAVYTHVDPSAPSFRAGIHLCKKSCEKSRFRDFDEIRYALRSALNYGVRSDGLTAGSVNGSKRRIPLLRKIHILVGDVDQVPKWVNTSHPALNIATHAEVFGSLGGNLSEYLPTFNTDAIELTAYRIPGIARFYLNVNNDMVIGRPLSVFDFFRPLSPARQEVYAGNYERAGLGSLLAPREGYVNLFLEPFSVSMGHARISLSPRVIRKDGNATGVNVSRPAELLSIIPKECPNTVPLRTSAFFDVRPLETSAIYLVRQHVTRNDFHLKVGTLPPLFQYTHMPMLIDRVIAEEFVDGYLVEGTERTRRHRERQPTSVIFTNVYPLLAIASRRAVERLDILRRGEWQRKPTSELFMFNASAMDHGKLRVLRDSVYFSDLGPLYGSVFMERVNHGISDVISRVGLRKALGFLGMWDSTRLFDDVAIQRRTDAEVAFYMVRSIGGMKSLAEKLQNMTEYRPGFLCMNDDMTGSVNETAMENAKLLLEAMTQQREPGAFEKKTRKPQRYEVRYYY